MLEISGLARNASIVLFPSQWWPRKPWGAIMSTCVCAISGGFYRELKIQPWLLWRSVSLAILASFVIKWIFQGSPEFTRIKSLLRDDQVDWPTQLTLVICISWSITNTSKIYKRTLQGYLLGKLESTQSKFSYAWIWYRSTISFIFMAWHTRLNEDLKFHNATLWEKVSLLAPKVLLDYLRPMITIHPIPTWLST